jgi:hypothetical protein
MKYVRCTSNNGSEASLNLDEIYRALEPTALERESGMLRIVDNEGEDYLYPARWFVEVPEHELLAELSQPLTVQLNGVTKIAIRDMAHAKGVSMSALVRAWIVERLDLPEAA